MCGLVDMYTYSCFVITSFAFTGVEMQRGQESLGYENIDRKGGKMIMG